VSLKAFGFDVGRQAGPFRYVNERVIANTVIDTPIP